MSSTVRLHRPSSGHGATSGKLVTSTSTHANLRTARAAARASATNSTVTPFTGPRKSSVSSSSVIHANVNVKRQSAALSDVVDAAIRQNASSNHVVGLSSTSQRAQASAPASSFNVSFRAERKISQPEDMPSPSQRQAAMASRASASAAFTDHSSRHVPAQRVDHGVATSSPQSSRPHSGSDQPAGSAGASKPLSSREHGQFLAASQELLLLKDVVQKREDMIDSLKRNFTACSIAAAGMVVHDSFSYNSIQYLNLG